VLEAQVLDILRRRGLFGTIEYKQFPSATVRGFHGEPGDLGAT